MSGQEMIGSWKIQEEITGLLQAQHKLNPEIMSINMLW